jgi:hypothetical protein
MIVTVVPMCNGQGRSAHENEEIEMILLETVSQKESGFDFAQNHYYCDVCSQQVTLRTFTE